MVRVKRGVVSRRKHKKILELTKGYRMTRSSLIKRAREAILMAGEHAFAGRKKKKRDFRQLWITRISEAVKKEGLSYNRFISALKAKKIGLDRKILADLVVNEPNIFKKIVEKIR